MSTTCPKEASIPVSTRRRTSTSRDEADILESGESEDQSYQKFDASGLKESPIFKYVLMILASALAPYFWLRDVIRFLSTPQENLDDSDFKKAEERFRYYASEKRPEGWASTATLMCRGRNTIIFRSFRYVQIRLLLNLQADIQILEEELISLDEADNRTCKEEKSKQNLRGRRKRKGTSAQEIVLEKLDRKITKYNDLMLKLSSIGALKRTPKQDHRSLFYWILGKKPLLGNEYEWIFHADDFVSLMPTNSNLYEEILRRKSTTRLGKYLKSFLYSKWQKNEATTSDINSFSNQRIGRLAKLCIVFSAVMVLYTPVVLFYMSSMTRESMAVVTLLSVFIFTVIMSVQRNCEAHEIFVGSATYCAVLVTFLGNLAGIQHGSGAVFGASSTSLHNSTFS